MVKSKSAIHHFKPCFNFERFHRKLTCKLQQYSDISYNQLQTNKPSQFFVSILSMLKICRILRVFVLHPLFECSYTGHILQWHVLLKKVWRLQVLNPGPFDHKPTLHNTRPPTAPFSLVLVIFSPQNVILSLLR